LKQDNFWEATSSIYDSGTWKDLLNSREKALVYIRKNIGDGKDTSLWFDPWTKDGRLIDMLDHNLPYMTGTKCWTVAQIIVDHQWIMHPFLNSIWNQIDEVHISGESDGWSWTANSNGDFSFISAWNSVRDIHEKFELFNVVWFPFSSPKMSCCLLKALKGRLPTRSRLKTFGIINEDSCVLCNEATETIDHLFFECPFTAYLWSLSRLKLGLYLPEMRNLIQEAELIQGKFKVKDKSYILSRLALQVTVWHIWLERNRRVFQHQQMNKIMIFRRLYEDINILLRTCAWKVNNKEGILSNWGL
jgi:hypothetical protein